MGLPIVAIVGPTASGKTRLSIALCQRPVSYTHLDVYKRQGEARGVFSAMMNQVNQVLQFMVTGETEEAGCSGNCGSCDGCH